MTHIFNSLKNYFRRLLFVVRVEGESGWPYLVPGKRYLASSLFVPRTGDWAVFRNPKRREEIFVKRVASAHDNLYIMEGAVSWAASSSDFGAVSRALILGKIFT